MIIYHHCHCINYIAYSVNNMCEHSIKYSTTNLYNKLVVREVCVLTIVLNVTFVFTINA